MINQSESHKFYKEKTQDIFDFIYLCCHAMPALNAYIKAVTAEGSTIKLPDADYFKSEPNYDRLKLVKQNYKKVLGNSLTLSLFSYFESYIFGLIKEILKFHEENLGESFVNFLKKKREESFLLESSESEIQKNIKKLQDRIKPEKKPSYSKAIKELSKTSYQFPGQLFAFYGIKQVERRIDKENFDFKAKDIPMIIEDVFGLELTEKERKLLEEIRETRNKIAHGNVITVELKQAIQNAKSLRKLAAKVDQHICKYFLIIEGFKP